MIRHLILSVAVLTLSCAAIAGGNEKITSFTQAKKLLKGIYADHRETFYCKASFLKDNSVILPEGFSTPKHGKRAKRIEWEHIVPAENFGRTFIEWREGHPDCIDKDGDTFKGRKCAEKTNEAFRLMQADMYNLVPAIGAVNALRSNYNYTELSAETPYTFGSCPMKIDGKKVQPPAYTKGAIARTYFYMESAYPRFRISQTMKKMMMIWDNQYPVTPWECERTKRIEKIQKNINHIVSDKCIKAGL